MYEYVKNYHGTYIQLLNGQEIERMDEVAFMFDRRNMCLLAHGSPGLVGASYLEKQRKRCLNGFRELVADLVYFQGKFKLTDINKMANSTDYVVEFYDRMLTPEPPIKKFELLGDLLPEDDG